MENNFLALNRYLRRYSEKIEKVPRAAPILQVKANPYRVLYCKPIGRIVQGKS